MMLWVAILLVVEMANDVAVIVASINWFISNNRKYSHTPLVLGAMAALLHAFRILVFVVGRVGIWVDFDYRPEYADKIHWTWFDVYFASIMSFLGVLAVLVIWAYRRQYRENNA